MSNAHYLPTIDYQANDAAFQFTHCLHETGFAVLKNHPLPQQQVDSIYRDWLAFFQSETKTDYHFDSKRFDGYFSTEVSETAKGHTAKDLKEYFHFYPWGCCPEPLKTALLAYQQQACCLAAELLGWIERHAPTQVSERFSEPLSEMIRDSEQSLLRVLHYPPQTTPPAADAMRAAAHEDINLLTILPAANEPGLQVQIKTGEWLDVPCDFGLLIINTGDMLQEASAGYFPSTTHRVINPPDEFRQRSRISLPLFLHPRPEVILSAHYTADSYLRERLRELGFDAD